MQVATILIIDDENSIRSTLKEILVYEKYLVLEASNGIEGIELIKKCIEQFGLKPMKGRPHWLLGEKR